MENPTAFQLLTVPFRGAYESAKDLFTPKSHAEAMVDEIYSAENRGLFPEIEAGYNPDLAQEPQVFVEAKETVKKTVQAATDSITTATKKYLLIGGIILLVLVFVYGFAGGLARR
jgi:hypothetical protein